MWAEKNIIAYQKDFASRRTPAVSDKLSHKILKVLITNQEEMSQMPKFKGRTPHQRLYIFFFLSNASPNQTDKEQMMEKKFGWFGY